MKFVLSGEYANNNGQIKQAVIDVTGKQVRDAADITASRDYDSAIGISRDILVDAPITIWAVPHPTRALKTSIHLTRSIQYKNVSCGL